MTSLSDDPWSACQCWDSMGGRGGGKGLNDLPFALLVDPFSSLFCELVSVSLTWFRFLVHLALPLLRPSFFLLDLVGRTPSRHWSFPPQTRARAPTAESRHPAALATLECCGLARFGNTEGVGGKPLGGGGGVKHFPGGT